MKENNLIPKANNTFMEDEENVYRRLRLMQETEEKKAPTQTELSNIFANELGIHITQGQISKLENDVLKEIPSREVLEAYSLYFGVSTDYLLGFSEMRTVNLEMRRTSFVTGLSEKSLIVLDYLRKFKGADNTATGLINYSTIRCINKILESYYKRVIQAQDDYCDNALMNDCSVNTLFSMIDDYFNASDAECTAKDKKVTFTRKNVSYPVDIEAMYEIMNRENIINELNRLKNLKEGDALD